MSAPTIHVTGDAYSAAFYVPPNTVFSDNWQPNEACVQIIPVGVEYIYRAIRASCNIHPTQTSNVQITRCGGADPFVCDSDGKTVALYEIGKYGEIAENDIKIPVLRCTKANATRLQLVTLDGKYPCVSGDPSPTNPDILVHWLGEMAGRNRKIPSFPVPHVCKFHVQVGLPVATSSPTRPQPEDLAAPTLARFIVVNIGEICAAYRVRQSLSYEAIAVDILRLLRGDHSNAIPSGFLIGLSMAGKAAPMSVLAVRINNSAAFVYACRSETDNNMFVEEGAWLLYHKSECAPVSEPELGQMAGYTGFVSAQLATTLAGWITNHPTAIEPCEEFLVAIRASVKRSLAWQHVAQERGCLNLLKPKEIKPGSAAAVGIATSTAVPAMVSLPPATDGYDRMFADIVELIRKKYKKEAKALKLSKALDDQLKVFDNRFGDDIHDVKVNIDRAVAYRTQWFIARSVAEDWDDAIRKSNSSEMDLENTFHKIAISWLCPNASGKAAKPGESPRIPIVRIGDAELTDRREVEDYLTILQAFRVYANSQQEKTPLGGGIWSAGRGKSSAVKNVVKHYDELNKGIFKKEALVFNLGQFKSLDDLPEAFHLVRNHCLGNEIPIVFFDEFDASFNGQPFGWLKYFLAPMQDGDFFLAGQTYKMGRAVFVFAGGVNHSFEEMNSRVRNPSFCEAKGPDFISRLKAHINVQGVNKPQDDADQYRYLLRRGIILRDMARKRLGIGNEREDVPLLHHTVANALLRIDRFKHGVRSLGAIIKMCTARVGHIIGPSDLPSMDQLEMHVDAAKLVNYVDGPEA